MTQYSPPPPPVPTPPYYHHMGGQPHPLSYSRRTSILMWCNAVIAIVIGLCTAGLMPMMEKAMSAAKPEDAEKMRQQMAEMERMAGGMSVQQIMTQAAIVIILWGGACGTIAYFVRSAKRGPAITGAVFTGIALAFLAYNLLGSLLMAGGAAFAQSLCVLLLPGAMLVLQFLWLLQTARAVPQVEALQKRTPPGGFEVMPPGTPSTPGDGERLRAAGSVTPQIPGAAPMSFTPPQPPTAAWPQQFGLQPPPPPSTGGGRYGYATRPKPPASKDGESQGGKPESQI